MSVFQAISLTVLSATILAEFRGLGRGSGRFAARWLRLAIWAAAVVSIARPELTQVVASAAGINRGADLVLYVFVLAFLGTSFYFYSRSVRLERQLTEVVRHLALQQFRGGVPWAED